MDSIRFDYLAYTDRGTHAPFDSVIVKTTLNGYSVHFYNTISGNLSKGTEYVTLAETIRGFHRLLDDFKVLADQVAKTVKPDTDIVVIVLYQMGAYSL